jgi:hypothetical protein
MTDYYTVSTAFSYIAYRLQNETGNCSICGVKLEIPGYIKHGEFCEVEIVRKALEEYYKIATSKNN